MRGFKQSAPDSPAEEGASLELGFVVSLAQRGEMLLPTLSAFVPPGCTGAEGWGCPWKALTELRNEVPGLRRPCAHSCTPCKKRKPLKL